MHAPGVYKITNKNNGKVYVGSTAKSIHDRWVCHKSMLLLRRHSNVYLQRSWDKHGADAFCFEVLELCSSDTCLELEQQWMDKLNACDLKHGYNINPVAGSMFGRRYKLKKPKPPITEETRSKMAAASRGRKASKEAKAKIAAALIGKNIGKKPSQETIEKIRIASTGKKHNQASKDKIRDANTGRVFSEETRKKMSEAAKKRGTSPQVLAALKRNTLSKKGISRPQEECDKISAALKGRVFSPETIQRMREGQQRRWNRQRGVI